MLQILAQNLDNQTLLLTFRFENVTNARDRILSAFRVPSSVNKISSVISRDSVTDPSKVLPFTTILQSSTNILDGLLAVIIEDDLFKPVLDTSKVVNSTTGTVVFGYRLVDG